MSKPDADQPAIGACPLLPGREPRPVDRGEHRLVGGGIVAAVINDGFAGACLERLAIGHLLGGDEIARAQRRAFHAELAGEPVEQALHDE
jgi:hypothetical protein